MRAYVNSFVRVMTNVERRNGAAKTAMRSLSLALLCTAFIRLQCPRAPTLRTVGDIAKSQFAKETVEVKVFEVASGIRTVGRNEVITIAARPIELSPVKMGPKCCSR